MSAPNHSARAHARMSPSTAEQWINCDAWLALTNELADTPSGPAALEGTLAHEWGEYLLREGIARAESVAPRRTPGDRLPPLPAEMAKHLQLYLDTVRAEAAGGEMAIETRVSLAAYFGNDDGDGTTDVEIYLPAEKHLKIIDLKYGAGKMVAAENNPQELQYCLGSFERYRRRGVSKLTLIIVQPRAFDQKIKRWEIDPLDLMAWADTMRGHVQRNKDVASRLAPLSDDLARHATTGEHCRWCKANYWGKCLKLSQQVKAIASDGFTAAPALAAPTADDLGARLRQVPALRAYITALEERAETEARAGRMPSGFKWTAGAGRRAWIDSTAAKIALCALGVDPYEKAFRTPSDIEKEIGKKKFASEMANFVTKPTTYNLNPVESDKPAVTPPFLAESGF